MYVANITQNEEKLNKKRQYKQEKLQEAKTESPQKLISFHSNVPQVIRKQMAD